MIYIAHPNDQTQNGHYQTMKEALERVGSALKARSLPAYWPIRPFDQAMEDPDATYDINEFALRRCSALLAVMPVGVPSIGAPMEILTAHQLGKPVAVWGQGSSMQLRAMRIPEFDWDQGPGLALTWLNQVTLIEPPRGPVLKWSGDPECEPRRGYEGDAGWDLYVEKDMRIPVGGFADVPNGISVEMPPGMWALVTGRSSTIRKRGLLVVNGIIDNGYRGPIFSAVQNLGDKPVDVKRGERLAQMIPFRLASQGGTFERVAELSAHERGLSAFGSTGL
jgi:dUTP pyrophosphatase